MQLLWFSSITSLLIQFQHPIVYKALPAKATNTNNELLHSWSRCQKFPLHCCSVTQQNLRNCSRNLEHAPSQLFASYLRIKSNTDVLGSNAYDFALQIFLSFHLDFMYGHLCFVSCRSPLRHIRTVSPRHPTANVRLPLKVVGHFWNPPDISWQAKLFCEC